MNGSSTSPTACRQCGRVFEYETSVGGPRICPPCVAEDNLLTGSTRPSRYGASVIDNLISFAIVFVVAESISANSLKGQSVAQQLVIGFSVFSLYFLYFFVFEWLLSITPGKWFAGLKIRHRDGRRCTARGAFLRTMTRPLEVNPVLLGAIPAALIVRSSKGKQRWGDMLADTVVVDHAK